MALRGKKPENIEKRLKVLFYGASGTGKTMASIQFPNPYMIDTEKGAENAQYVDILNNNGGVVFQTTDFDELLQEVMSLLTEKHNFKTLIVDPMTTLYMDLLAKAEREVGNKFGRHYGVANLKMKRLMNLLLRLDMNVIITSHAKNEYGDNLNVLGQTFDCYKKLDYLFDLVLEVQKIGAERLGIVKKTRLKSFPEFETFPFSYEEISKRYGEDIIMRESVPRVLATPESVEELEGLINLTQTSDKIKFKWLDKAAASSFEEMDEDQLQKCIEYLKTQVKPDEDIDQ